MHFSSTLRKKLNNQSQPSFTKHPTTMTVIVTSADPTEGPGISYFMCGTQLFGTKLTVRLNHQWISKRAVYAVYAVYA
jgi:hypothetical protein